MLAWWLMMGNVPIKWSFVNERVKQLIVVNTFVGKPLPRMLWDPISHRWVNQLHNSQGPRFGTGALSERWCETQMGPALTTTGFTIGGWHSSKRREFIPGSFKERILLDSFWLKCTWGLSTSISAGFKVLVFAQVPKNGKHFRFYQPES